MSTYRATLYTLLLCLLLPACETEVPPEAPADATQDYRIIGYVFGARDPSTIDATMLTHINYAFANVVDGKAMLVNDHDTDNLIALNALKAQNPDLKLLVSVGGWSWSENFSDAALTDSSRDVFARSVINLVTTHQLDGIDIDWEYPGQIGEDNIYRPEDKQNFTLFLKEIREQLDALSDQEGRAGKDRYLLTIATGANDVYLEHTEMDKAQAYLDFVNIMTYDFYGVSSPRTGHHTNLYPSASDSVGMASSVGVDWHLAAGIPADKLVLGVAFYGKSWRGVNAENNGFGQPYERPNRGFSFHTLKAEYVDQQGFVRYWDEDAKAPYLWHPDSLIFITYDDEESMRHKAEYIKEKGLGGAMYWQHYSDSTQSLLSTIYHTLNP